MDELTRASTFSTSLQAAATATARATPQDAEDSARQELIERLKLQVSQGTYQPDAAGISERIIDDLLES